MRPEDHLAVGGAIVSDDDGLAAAEIQAGHGVLVRHSAGEAQRVDDGFFVTRVVPEPRSAERGAEHGAMDRDDPAIAGGAIVAHHELLVPHRAHTVE